ncbi:helix-turn-helix domain-containing protein [Mammaliicoccus stepanovicii]|uniref:Transcriptional regulator n=1 Tax=Mammaliicoccus stepanovicii TaxID=643214 RepID=A0A239YLK4_9STAP|nr:helix-turn-helix transcriptional regulator [Mammaliicoccus stepanovicii]PNZ76867.1 transcriptional regulator [Mammaliicoccus stepanovicii]GGI41087.1 transcriptional regulator [Mammaliicoccus stepanovicii]CPN60389.1 transcriptional regulator [Staphylococcus aureus]SNV59610.1 transcriptional regulator [Mammaliicoccus stepanovicii]
MIKIKLDEILKEKGVTLTELSQAVDVTIANLSILKTGKAKAVRFSTLEAICEFLNCQPGDIMVYDKETT